MSLRIDQMRAYVVLDDLGHETSHGATRAGNEVHNLLTRRLALNSAFNSVNLSPKATNARKQLPLIANGVAHSQTIAYLPILYGAARSMNLLGSYSMCEGRRTGTGKWMLPSK